MTPAIFHPLSESVKGSKYLVSSKKLNGQVHKIVLVSLQFITSQKKHYWIIT